MRIIDASKYTGHASSYSFGRLISLQPNKCCSSRRRCQFSAAVATETVQFEAKYRVLDLLARKTSFPKRDPEIEAALSQLIREPSSGGGPATLKLGQGTWEVFSAPHLSWLGEVLGAAFSPVRYSLKGSELTANVRYSSSIFQEGWLSASGLLEVVDSETVKVVLNKFWVDRGSNALRPNLEARELYNFKRPAFEEIFKCANHRGDSTGDAAVDWIGRLFFIQQLSSYPVLFVDSDIAVFKFPPLESNIAVRRI